MNKRIVAIFRWTVSAVLLLVACGSSAEESSRERAKHTELWEPVPSIVHTGEYGVAPSDAIVLFAGGDLSRWESAQGGEAKWTINPDGSFTVAPFTGGIRTKQSFGDVQLHVEWRAPEKIVGEGQGRGNSGIFLMERYELQILDSFDNETYVNGQAGSIYKQHIPLVNSSKPPGEWQAFDIIFTAPHFGASGRVVQPATITVLHNGVLVQNHVSLHGPTKPIGATEYEAHGLAPIKLQDHGNLNSYRNIWLRVL